MSISCSKPHSRQPASQAPDQLSESESQRKTPSVTVFGRVVAGVAHSNSLFQNFPFASPSPPAIMGKSKRVAPATIKKSAKVIPEKIVDLAEEEWETEDEEEDEDDETGGVDEPGMKRLMELLGDDALDEFDAAQLDALKGDDSGDEEGSESGSEDGSEEEEQEGPLSDEDSEEDEEQDEDGDVAMQGEDGEDIVALDDVSSVDEDAVPRQKVVIDNKVRPPRILSTFSNCRTYIHSRFYYSGCPPTNSGNNQARLLPSLDRNISGDVPRASGSS